MLILLRDLISTVHSEDKVSPIKNTVKILVFEICDRVFCSGAHCTQKGVRKIIFCHHSFASAFSSGCGNEGEKKESKIGGSPHILASYFVFFPNLLNFTISREKIKVIVHSPLCNFYAGIGALVFQKVAFLYAIFGDFLKNRFESLQY